MNRASDTGPTAPPVLAPIGSKARIASLDVLRGLALLGILAVNAISFAAPAWFDPAQLPPGFPVAVHADFARWIIDTFFSQKFVTLFSMLFGVSLFLVGGEQGDQDRSPLLKRRLKWLAVIGLIHGLIFWYGDILLLYAAAGAIALRMRSWDAQRLIRVGLGGTLILGILQSLMLGLLALFPSDNQGDLFETAASLAAYQSGWPAGLIENLKAWAMAQGMSFALFLIPTVLLMMLGLGLFKSGFFHGQWSRRSYGGLVLLGGLLVALLGVLSWPHAPWRENSFIWIDTLSSFPVLITLAYASLLICLRDHVSWLGRRLAPVGQMALTNYLSQTLIMASLFYLPWGPRLMGHVDEVSLWAIVGLIWLAQLIWSPLWLSRFRMGPMEWLWRCLTYGRRLPLRRV